MITEILVRSYHEFPDRLENVNPVIVEKTEQH